MNKLNDLHWPELIPSQTVREILRLGLYGEASARVHEALRLFDERQAELEEKLKCLDAAVAILKAEQEPSDDR